MTESRRAPVQEARTRIPYINPPLVMMLEGEQAISGRGVISRLPAPGPADEMLSRLSDRLGADPLVMIAPGNHAWEYLTTDAKAWNLTGGPAWWTATRDDRRVRLCLLGYADATNDPMIDPNHRLTLVRHQRYALLTGVNFYAEGGTTGLRLMDETINVKGAPPLRAWRNPQAPKVAEPYWPGPWGRNDAAGVKIDKNGQFLCATNAALLPLDALSRILAPSAAMTKIYTGLWHITVPENPEPRLPHPCGWLARPGEKRWVASPTLELLLELGVTPEISEAWVCQRERSRRALVPWYERLRDARKALDGNPDPDSAAIRQALKDTYSRMISSLAREGQRRWYRPDWRQIIHAEARTCMWRFLLKAGRAEDRWPASVSTDSVVYEGDRPPAMFRIGTELGQWKVTP